MRDVIEDSRPTEASGIDTTAPPSSFRAGLPRRHKQIFGIDLIRFFAAGLVMTYHLAFLSWAAPVGQGRHVDSQFAVYAPLAPYLMTGWVGVQIFFVISGFVVSLSANGRSPLSFAKSRFLRLAPGVWICATLTVPFLLLAGEGAGEALRQYCLSIIFSPFGPWVASSYWTLSIEIVFYVCIFFLLAVNRFYWAEMLAWTLGVFSTILWTVVGALLLALEGHPEVRHILMGLTHTRLSLLVLAPHGCLFALGMLIWLASAHGLTRWRTVGILVFAIGGLIEVAVETQASADYLGRPESMLSGALTWALAMAALIISIRFNEQIGDGLSPMLRKAIRSIGLATYPLYLIHQPLGGYLIAMLLRAHVPAAYALALGILTVIATSLCVAMIGEPLVRRWIASWSLGRFMPTHFAYLRHPTLPVARPRTD